jgi:hypothetical protein
MTRRVLVPSVEIERVLNLAQERGLTIAGLDVGRDYVRLIPQQIAQKPSLLRKRRIAAYPKRVK